MMHVIRFLSDAALITWVLAPLQFWLIYRSNKHPEQRYWSVLAIALTAPIMLIAFALILTTIVDLGAPKPGVDRFFEDAVPLIGTALALGLGLFTFRKADRALYGIAEVLFATITAGYAAWAPEQGFLPRLLALGAAIYIVVRGLDNIDQGRSAGSRTGQWLNARLPRDSPE